MLSREWVPTLRARVASTPPGQGSLQRGDWVGRVTGCPGRAMAPSPGRDAEPGAGTEKQEGAFEGRKMKGEKGKNY